MTTQDMPGLVRAQLKVHIADTLLALERVRAELDRTTTSTARSRVLRGLREQLTAQLEAWEYLTEVSGSGMQARASEPESDPDDECVCTHPRHAHNPQGLCVKIPGVTGCGCLGFLDRREYRG